jgi:AcrR family transcriptional regulator
METMNEIGPTHRRRGDALRRAILDAALELLGMVGYGQLTMEGVAARAGTGKAALYRRWPSREELVADALGDALPSPAAVPVSGEVRDDVLALLECMRTAFTSTHGAAFQAVKADGGPGAGLLHSVVQQRVVEPCERLVLDALRRGAERGQVRPDAVTTKMARVGPAMVIHHALTDGSGMSDDYLASIVDDVVLPLVRP